MFKYAGRVPALTYIKTNDGAHTYFFITVSRKSAALLRLKNTACELFTGITLKIAGSCAMHIAVLTKEYQQTADTDRAMMLLAEIDEAERNRIELIVPELAKQNGVTDKLKAENQMEWVRQMNACKAQAEEVVKAELIYN